MVHGENVMEATPCVRRGDEVERKKVGDGVKSAEDKAQATNMATSSKAQARPCVV